MLAADAEGDTRRDGYLSRRAEWHAAAWGASVAVLYVATGNPMFLTGGLGWVLTRAGDPTAGVEGTLRRELATEAAYVVGHAAFVVAIAELAVWLARLG